MIKRWAGAGLGLALVAAAATGAAGQTPAPPAQPGSEEPLRLGRKYPAPVPARPATREEPQVHVSIVSPRESGVHQKIGRRRGTRVDSPEGDPETVR